ncbi:hypothetical protein [Bradyrhizobium arachidis]|uniref:hypothetical protein n=1 Tax=Bradyrhizobium arachidis TaxID=858423 RepID=UPI002163292A|nr:hypothetical protein [Bradyrhizobium arachidis]UVO30247.1 hypothetical protein KUF59_05700 [Bradyrhizobium arachidis]
MPSTTIEGRQYRIATKKGDLRLAEEVAEQLRGLVWSGDLEKVTVHKKKTFLAAAEKCLEEFPVLTEGQRNSATAEIDRTNDSHLLKSRKKIKDRKDSTGDGRCDAEAHGHPPVVLRQSVQKDHTSPRTMYFACSS